MTGDIRLGKVQWHVEGSVKLDDVVKGPRTVFGLLGDVLIFRVEVLSEGGELEFVLKCLLPGVMSTEGGFQDLLAAMRTAEVVLKNWLASTGLGQVGVGT